jgi:hypothetical protein
VDIEANLKKKYSFRAAIKFYQRALDFLDKIKE